MGRARPAACGLPFSGNPRTVAELALGGDATLPFPVAGFAAQGRHWLFGAATNRRGAADEAVRRHRGRCGRSEEVHAALKGGLAGGRTPSGLFGANAAWWAIAVTAHNLDAAMKRPALRPGRPLAG